MLLTWGVKAIAGLIPIYFHLNKIIRQHYLWVASLPKQYTINTLINEYHSKKTLLYCIIISHLIAKQQLKVKSPIMDTNNHLNEVLLSSNSLNKELSPGLVDTFLECFSFLLVSQKNSNTLTSHYNKLNNIFENSLVNQDTVLIITDTSVKNNIAILISYIYRGQEIIVKFVCYAINVTFIEAELFTIGYRIN